jgi:hypothetical protein
MVCSSPISSAASAATPVASTPIRLGGQSAVEERRARRFADRQQHPFEILGVRGVENTVLRKLDAADTDLQQRVPEQAPLGVALDEDGDVAGRQSAFAERDAAGLRGAQQARHFAGGGAQHLLLRFAAQQILAVGSRQPPDAQRRRRFLAVVGQLVGAACRRAVTGS